MKVTRSEDLRMTQAGWERLRASLDSCAVSCAVETPRAFGKARKSAEIYGTRAAQKHPNDSRAP